MMRLVRMLVPAAAAAAAAALALTFHQGSPARVAAGLLLVLILPGHAALAVMQPSRRLGVVHVPLTVGLSLSIVALVGLVLNCFESGLGRTNWAVELAALTVLLTSIGVVRRPFGPVRPSPRRSARASIGRWLAAAAAVVPYPIEALSALLTSIGAVGRRFGSVRRSLGRSARSSIGPWLAVAAAVVPATVLAGVALARSADSAAHQPRPGFTVLGAWHGPSNREYLQLTSYEHEPVSYRLRADVDGHVLIDRSYRLSSGASVSTAIRLPYTRVAETARIVVYRRNDPEPYRRLTIVFPGHQ